MWVDVPFTGLQIELNVLALFVQTVATITVALATILYAGITYLTLLTMNKNAMINTRPIITFAKDDFESYDASVREVKLGEYLFDRLALDIVNRGTGPALNIDCKTNWKFGFLMTNGLCTVMKEGEQANVIIENVEQSQPLVNRDSLNVVFSYESIYSEKFRFTLEFSLVAGIPTFLLFEARHDVVKKRMLFPI
jgi:hypothetical protein